MDVEKIVLDRIKEGMKEYPATMKVVLEDIKNSPNVAGLKIDTMCTLANYGLIKEGNFSNVYDFIYNK